MESYASRRGGRIGCYGAINCYVELVQGQTSNLTVVLRLLLYTSIF